MGQLIDELKRRNVIRVAAAYAVVGWVVLQVVTSIDEPLGLPAWTDTLVIVLLGMGFPVAILLAWAFEMTPEGVKKTRDVDKDASVTSATGQKINYLIVAALALSLNAAPSLGYVLKHPHMKAIQTHGDFPALVAKYGLVWKDQSPGAKL